MYDRQYSDRTIIVLFFSKTPFLAAITCCFMVSILLSFEILFLKRKISSSLFISARFCMPIFYSCWDLNGPYQ